MENNIWGEYLNTGLSQIPHLTKSFIAKHDEVIEAANQYGMALYFSGIRHFLH
ncbi:hypothetical protein N5U17_06690 [Aliarcobacter butzleri]|uniref:hypothetical protein n=1 Tax=Aliarcobacter butzleri TaxID=28197 RepID=UPI0021B4D4E6|nr:hypothetical protein [Aliarcobacter butzleri]MCT7603912.1 hypothetical protein [Aliarcobacter butzleri]MCT7609841.1 hypothetical protein [Aliarcobacter butzleri]MCT7647784.1 hypothetical protein [Aliarcobacter butzleri]